MKKILFDLCSYIRCEAEGAEFTIYVNSFPDSKNKMIKFHNTIKLIYRSGDYISKIYETCDENLLLQDALTSHYELVPSNHAFKMFILFDLNNRQIFEVVAEIISITE